jgi:hypothetical protein
MKRALVVTAAFIAFAGLSLGVVSAKCPDTKVLCVKPVDGKIFVSGHADGKGKLAPEPSCWKNWSCQDCDGDTWPIYASKCNAQYPACDGLCVACQLYQDYDAITYDPCYDKNGVAYDSRR